MNEQTIFATKIKTHDSSATLRQTEKNHTPCVAALCIEEKVVGLEFGPDRGKKPFSF